MTVLTVIAILVVLIVAHELGHFIAAKLFRVRVEEFGVGYPPRAFTFGKLGDTEYTLNWIPFGGFVRLFGDAGEKEHGRGSLVDASKWKQAVILVAGVAMNALLAWFLFAAALHTGLPHVVDTPIGGEKVSLMVTDVVAGSPAGTAGLKPGDQITAVQDNRGSKPASLTPEDIVKFVSVRGGVPIALTYLHEGVSDTVAVIPANAVVPGAAGRPALGLALALVATRSEPWGAAIAGAFTDTRQAFISVGSELWDLVGSALRGAPNLSGVVGPVGIVSYVGEASQSGFGAVLYLAALISVNLALINLIPIPALDGGRLFILVIEAAMRRPAPRLFWQALNAFGVALIVILMLVVTYHDVTRLFA